MILQIGNNMSEHTSRFLKNVCLFGDRSSSIQSEAQRFPGISSCGFSNKQEQHLLFHRGYLY